MAQVPELCELGELRHPDERSFGFAESFAVDGDTAVVRIKSYDIPEPCEPVPRSLQAVLFYTRHGTTWDHSFTIRSDDLGGGDVLRGSVAISGDLFVAGGNQDGDLGSAFVYRRSGEDWIQEAKIVSPAPEERDRFGAVVSIDQDRLAIGAPKKDCAVGEDCGSVYIYYREGTNWILEATLTAPVPLDGDRFGSSVDLDGTRIAVGTTFATHTVHVFRQDGDAWVHEVELAPLPDRLIFQTPVLHDDVLLVRAQTREGNEPDSSFYAYHREIIDDSATWVLEARPAKPPSSNFPEGLDIRGELVVAGASFEPTGNTGDTGAVYVYRRSGGAWNEELRLTRSPSNFFGAKVALTRNFLFAYGVNSEISDVARMYVYGFGDLSDESDCNANATLDVCEVGLGLTPDCNVNGVPDECDIAAGTSADSNANTVPDECEDCNNNGIPDDTDIIDETSLDCNANGVPDDCIELELDCNGNGVPDACDLTDGTSLDCNANDIPDDCIHLEVDCNGNGIPDACDLESGSSSDCNSNGLADDCDIAGGTSSDCNANSVPDECDLAAGTSVDCNLNNVPDECDLDEDCNVNGVQDICDVAAGGSDDCNGDEVPDECQPDEDCNANGTRDICDIGTGADVDCNGNLSPDTCDLEAGLSLDEDGDGIPDECCVVAEPPQLETILDDQGAELDLTKIRALAVTVGSAIEAQAIRVTFINLPAPLDIANGSRMWVGEPFVVCENSGQAIKNDPGACGSVPDDTPLTTTYAELQCDPLYREWSGLGIINIVGELVVPRGSFDIQVIDIRCPIVVETNYSDPLTVTNPIWGDLVKDCKEDPCEPPDNSVDIVTDVTAVLSKFMNRRNSPEKARCDLEPSIVDFLINISDVTFVLNAFGGCPDYPFTPSAAVPCTGN